MAQTRPGRAWYGTSPEAAKNRRGVQPLGLRKDGCSNFSYPLPTAHCQQPLLDRDLIKPLISARDIKANFEQAVS